MSKEQEENPLLGTPKPILSKATIEDIADADVIFMLEAVERYTRQGKTQIEAEAYARNDIDRIKKQHAEQGEAMWNRLNKELKTWQLYHDQIVRALAFYSGEWMEKNKPHTLYFKFNLTTDNVQRDRKGNIRTIAAAHLALDFAVNGVWTPWFKKTINFVHYREMKEGDQWKLELYEAAFRELILYGCTYRLQIDGFITGRIKISDNSGGEGITPEGTTGGAETNIVSGPSETGEGTPS
jgi:hypothetical protein